jgi:hypothetical protein
MNFGKVGIVFFVVFLGLSILQRLMEGVGFSIGNTMQTLVTGLLATVAFVVLIRLVGK